ncbi:MAG: AAA family ATPase, partial [Bryobacteraceae bacterium]|nr:AAA family ATPase [Bryobacteraceae bacterium]
TLVELLSTHSPNVCFLDTSTDRDRALSTIAELNTLSARLPIVALLPANDSELILRFLRQGATEFLIQPFTSEQLGQVMERLSKKFQGSKSDAAQGKVYCLMPAKGACGATTVACNLAFQLKRTGHKRVLLADLDALTGTVSFLLKLKSQYSFLDAIDNANKLDPDLWKGIVVQTQGVDVLLSPEQADAGYDRLDPAALIDFARTQYDAIVFDTGAVYGSWNLTVARNSDELLLTTTNELPALQASQRALSYLDSNRVDRERIRMVVNRYNRDVGLSKEVIETALHEEVYHVLPSDYDSVQRALIDGRPIPPSSHLGKGLTQLADRLSGKQTEVHKKAATTSSWSGLLNLFGRTSS